MPSQLNRRAVAAGILLAVFVAVGCAAGPRVAHAGCYKKQNQRGCCLGHQCLSCSRDLYPDGAGNTYDYRVLFDYPWSMAPSQPPAGGPTEVELEEARKGQSKKLAQRKSVKIISPTR